MADCIGCSKSFNDTFLREIGAEGTFSRSLYKIPWLLGGVNFLVKSDDWSRTGSIYEFIIPSEFCSATEPAPTISEGSVLLPKSAGPVGVPGAALP